MPWKNSWFQLAALVAIICGGLLIYDAGSKLPIDFHFSDIYWKYVPPAFTPLPAPTSPPVLPVAGQSWTNSLGMKFIPAGTNNVLFCIWDVRVKDYAVFVSETGHNWQKPDFPQTENDPVVNVLE